MSKIFRYLILGLLIALVIMQFVGPERPATLEENPNDLIQSAGLSDSISSILRDACYDCHSNETKYPWYGSIAPSSWFLYKHVRDGREELNFSDWASFDKRTKIKLLKKIEEELEEGEMPLSSYKIVHKKAQLQEEEINALLQWVDGFAKEVFSGK